MTERAAPNPPPWYSCLWDDEVTADTLQTLSVNYVTETERQRIEGLLSGLLSLPAECIVTYSIGFWIAHVTGDFTGVDESGRQSRRRGCRIVGKPHGVYRDTFVVAAVFPESQYSSYLAFLQSLRG